MTRIAPQRKAGRASVYIDHVFAFGVLTSALTMEGVYVDTRLDVSAQERLLGTNDYLRCKRTAADYLSRRLRTTEELRKKLLDKGFTASSVKRTVERFVELGYLNDRQFAGMYARDRIVFSRRGCRRVTLELKKKGVAEDLIAAGLSTVNPEAIVAAARASAEKKSRSLTREPDGFKRRKKVLDFLRRRGFSRDIIRQAMSDLSFESTFTDDQRRSARSKRSRGRPSLTLDEARPLAKKRYDQLCRLERSRAARQRKLKDFLVRRGLPYGDASTLLAEVQAEEVEELDSPHARESVALEEAMTLAEPRWRKLLRLEKNDRKRQQKLKAFLQRRGVSFDVISEVLTQVTSEA